MGVYDQLGGVEGRAAAVAAARAAVTASGPAPRRARARADRSPSKLLTYLAERTVNGEHAAFQGKAPAVRASWVDGAPAIASPPPAAADGAPDGGGLVPGGRRAPRCVFWQGDTVA